MDVKVELHFECPNGCFRATKILPLAAIPMPGDGLDCCIDDEDEDDCSMFLVEGRIFTVGQPTVVYCGTVKLASEAILDRLKDSGWDVSEMDDPDDEPDTLTEIHTGVDDANRGISSLLGGEHLKGIETTLETLEESVDALKDSIHELVAKRK
jgi:hypothetical protein